MFTSWVASTANKVEFTLARIEDTISMVARLVDGSEIFNVTVPVAEAKAKAVEMQLESLKHLSKGKLEVVESFGMMPFEAVKALTQ